MKVVERRDRLYKSPDLETHKFRIAESSKAFEILSSRLYSDTVLAIIRELSTNAFDAHKFMGKENEPFDVHLPNWSNSNFIIRDFGPGLSPDEIYNVYTVLFESTKTSSNDYVGCLGLGSKSPFSYTKSFTIESFNNGKKYIYLAHIDTDGCPAISELPNNGEASDEPSGLKITIAVKQDDFSRFKERARDIYTYFKVQPNISGQDLDIKPIKYNLSGKNWGLYEWPYEDYREDFPIAVMGSIAYQLDPHQFATGNWEIFFDRNIVLFFDIGELDIDASREKLHYNTRTINHLKFRLAEIEKEILKVVQQKIDNSKTLWEARCNLCNIIEEVNDANVIDVTTFTYKGKQIVTQNTNSIYSTNLDGVQDLTLKQYQKTSWRITPYVRENKDISWKLTTKFVIDDLKRGGPTRAKAYARDNNCDVVVFEFKDAKMRQEVVDLLCIQDSDIGLTSTLPATKSKTRQSTGVLTQKIMKFNSNRYYATQAWESTTVNLNDGGIFVEFKQFRWKDENGDFVNYSELRNKIKNLEQVGVTVPDIYGIKTAVLAKAKQVGQWEDFNDWYKAEVDKFDLQSIAQIKADQDYYSRIPKLSADFDEVVKYVNKNTVFAEFYEDLEKAKKAAEVKTKNSMKVNNYLHYFDLDIPVVPASCSMRHSVDDIYSKYELLQHISFPYYYGNSSARTALYKKVASYINSLG